MVDTRSIVDLAYAKVEMLENNIVRVKFNDSYSIGVDECREVNNAIGVVTNGTPARILMIPEYATQFDTGAREFSASDEGLQFTIADAMVITNLAHKILVSFYLKFDKPKKPTKAFNNESDAISWLLKQNS